MVRGIDGSPSLYYIPKVRGTRVRVPKRRAPCGEAALHPDDFSDEPQLLQWKIERRSFLHVPHHPPSLWRC